MLSPKYTLVDKETMKDKALTRLISPLTMAEMISNKNTAVDITQMYQKFIEDSSNFGDPGELPVKPLMCMTDCSPQLESGALNAFASEGKITSRILYGNVVLIHLLHYDKMILDSNIDSPQEAAKQVFDALRPRVGVFLKECASHVYRAPHSWVHRNKSSELCAAVKLRFENLFKASFSSLLKDNRISEVIVQLAVILAVLETERFETPSFTDTDVIRSSRNDEDRRLEQSHATAIDAFIRSEAKELLVHSAEDVASRLKEAPNDKHLLLHEPIVDKAKLSLTHCCVYLSMIAVDNVTGSSFSSFTFKLSLFVFSYDNYVRQLCYHNCCSLSRIAREPRGVVLLLRLSHAC